MLNSIWTIHQRVSLVLSLTKNITSRTPRKGDSTRYKQFTASYIHRHSVNLSGQSIHILAQLLVGDTGVNLSGSDVGVAEHFTHRFDRYTVAECDRCCK